MECRATSKIKKGIVWGLNGYWKYEGQFNLEGEKHGQGTLYSSEGSVYYKGQWRDNYVHGQGVMHYKDGTTYKGEFESGYPHGCGTLYDKFEKILHRGEFKYGKRYHNYFAMFQDSVRK